MASTIKRQGLFRRLRSKYTFETTRSGSIEYDITSSKEGEALETRDVGFNTKLTEPQAEGSRTSRPIEVSQTLEAPVTEPFEASIESEAATVEDSIESETTSADTIETQAAHAPFTAPEVGLVNSAKQRVSNLWDEAYDTLKSEDPDRVDRYERILTLWLREEAQIPAWRPWTREPFENVIVPSDPGRRREQMSKIVGLWLSNTGEDESKEDRDSDTHTREPKIVHPLRKMMRSTVRDISHSALLWAGACLSVQGLSDPALRSDAVILGIGHILSRTAWYNVIPNLLGSDIAAKRGDSTEEQHVLRSRMISLYKAVLSYQIGVVCSQSSHLRGRPPSTGRHQTSPSTSGTLTEADIVDAENALACFRGQHVQAHIRGLVEALHNEGPGVIRNGEQTMARRLKDLNAIDTQQSISDLISRRGRTLWYLYEWIRSTPAYVEFNTGDARVLWVSGDTGRGTTMLMLAIVHGLNQQTLCGSNSENLSYSFCSIGQRRPENVASVVKSLIFLVLMHQPWLTSHLDRKCKLTDRKHFSHANDFYALSLVLYGMIQDDEFKPTLFVVDGIEECVIQGLDDLVSLIVTTMRLSPRVKWVASIPSNKNGIVSTLLGVEMKPHLNLDCKYAEVENVFEKYHIPSKVDELANHARYEGDFRAEVTAKLFQLSSCNFLWADTACEAVMQDDPWHAVDNLDIPVHIDPLYIHMKGKIESLSPKDQTCCFRVLLAAAIAFRPLEITELEAIVDLPPEVNLRILIQRRCFAFLELRDGTVYFTHSSARHFVTQNMEAHIAHEHSRIVQRCLRSLTNALGKSVTDSDDKTSGDLVIATNYAAVSWIRHLHYTEGIEENDVVRFLTDQPLKWLDLLASQGQQSQAWELMREFETLLKEKLKTRPSEGNIGYGQEFLRLIRETLRLLHFHQLIKRPAAARAKNSLLFCPNNSTTRQRLLPSEFPELAAPPVVEQSWSGVVKVLRGHSDYVRCCAYSHDGKFLASASDDGSVRIWDTTTGKVQHVFDDFDYWVYLVAFSSQGLLAASDRNSIKIWDVITGKPQRTENDMDLYAGNLGKVADISFSDDGSMLVAVGDDTITIWKVPSFSVIVFQETSLRQDNNFEMVDLRHVRFSSDGTLLGTVSADFVTIWKLDIETENGAGEKTGDQPEMPAQNHIVNETTNEAAKEPATVVGYKQELWKLRNLREFQVKVENDDEGLHGVAFSPDSKFVAVGMSRDSKVHIWELKSDKPPIILSGHTGVVNGVSFSPDGSILASVSDDYTTRIWRAPWDGADKQPALILRGHSMAVYALSFSPRQRHLATCSGDGTIRIWDYDGYEVENEPEAYRQAQPHTRPICFVAFSDDGKLIASASEEGLICLWDGKSGAVLRVFRGHEQYVPSLVFSCDSKRLVSASIDETVRVWDTTGKVEPRILYGHTGFVRSAMLSRDGRLVVSGSDDRTVCVWDITRPNAGKKEDRESEEDKDGKIVLRGHAGFIFSVACSDNGKYVASGGSGGDVLLWELSMDQPSTAHEHKAMKSSSFTAVVAVVFVSDASKLIASSHEKISIWNTATCDLVREVMTVRTFTLLQVNPAFPLYLMTEVGPIPMEDLQNPDLCSVETKSTAWSPYSVASYSSESWITWNEKRVIFLPEQYRPILSARVRVHRHNVVIGCRSGSVLFFRFREVVNFRTL